MKKLLFTFCLVALSTSLLWADDIIYCTPYGANYAANANAGISWNTALSPIGVVDYLNNPNFCRIRTNPGVLTIYLLKGDYYDELVLNGTTVTDALNRASISNIHIYGSCSGSSPVEFPNQRDFENGRTYFHAGASGNCPLWIDFAPHTGGNVCIVDGIWFDTYDGNYYQSINDYAMCLVGGHYFISHCTVQDFYTTAPLLFLEGGNETFHIVNSVFAKDKAKHFLEAFCNLQIINSTIADIDLLDELIGRTIAHNMYRVDNTIIYNCLNYNNYYNEPFDIRNCIVETYNSSWMIDNGNYWNTDPQFTGYPTAPYSCDAYSVASDNGYYADLTALAPYLPFTVILFDAGNHPRFEDLLFTHLDIGAYQHYSGGNYYYQNAYNPNPMMAPQQNRESAGPSVFGNDNGFIYNLLGQPVDDTYHGIVIRNGQKMLQ